MSRFFTAPNYIAEDRIIEAIRADRAQVADLDSDASEQVDGDEWTRVFGTLADIGGRGGLLELIAPLIGDLPAGRLDEFATLCRIADAMTALRDREIVQKAADQIAALQGWGG